MSIQLNNLVKLDNKPYYIFNQYNANTMANLHIKSYYVHQPKGKGRNVLEICEVSNHKLGTSVQYNIY